MLFGRKPDMTLKQTYGAVEKVPPLVGADLYIRPNVSCLHNLNRLALYNNHSHKSNIKQYCILKQHITGRYINPPLRCIEYFSNSLVQVRTNGDIHPIQIKSGKIDSKGRLVLSGYRMGTYKDDWSAITNYLESKQADLLSVAYEQINDDKGRQHIYKVSYIDAEILRDISADAWQKVGAQYKQANSKGVEFSVCPSMSWQIWWAIPLEHGSRSSFSEQETKQGNPRPVTVLCFVACASTDLDEGRLRKETQDASRLKRKASYGGSMTSAVSSLLYNPPQV